jgi:hypothetical protein
MCVTTCSRPALPSNEGQDDSPYFMGTCAYYASSRGWITLPLHRRVHQKDDQIIHIGIRRPSDDQIIERVKEAV